MIALGMGLGYFKRGRASFMLRYLYFMALISLGLAVSAQPGMATQSTNSADPGVLYKLEGRVINAETGRPLPRALVEVYMERKLAMLTGPEGEFAFDKIPKGTYMVRAQKPGFFDPSGRGQQSPLATVEIGPQTGKIALKLAPECVISGAVVNDEGESIEGAVIDVLISSIVEGRRQVVPVRNSVRTDEDGNFRIAGLQSGKYFVSVKAGPASRRLLGELAKNRAEAYPAIVYFPSAGDLASATAFDLAPGQHGEARFALSLVPAFKLAGMVAGTAGYKQVSNPVIMDATERPLFGASRWDGQTGAFEFPALPSGTYTLRVYAMAEDNHPSWVRQSITLNRDIPSLNLALQPGATIPVSVRTELNSKPLPSNCYGGFIGIDGKALDCSKVSAMVMLSPAEMSHMKFRAEAESDDPSAMAVRGVMPGRYRVEVMPMISAYVRSVRCGGVDLLREELIVPAGGNVPPIEVILRDDGATVKVHVQGESPEHARILLLPDFAPYQRPPMLDVSSAGDREYGGLAPGEYKVLAFDSMEGIEYGNPEFLAKYSSKAARVTLSAHATSNVTVELVHTGE
jgi:hypothetical protein